jgi:hypothetical protein
MEVVLFLESVRIIARSLDCYLILAIRRKSEDLLFFSDKSCNIYQQTMNYILKNVVCADGNFAH